MTKRLSAGLRRRPDLLAPPLTSALLRDMLKTCHEILATMEAQPQPDHELVELMRATCRALEARLDGVEAA